MSGPELHRGKLARHPRILSVRTLTVEDIARLREPRAGAPRLKKLRRIHHTTARLIAKGFSDADICRLTGYSLSRLTTLKVDPSVQELIAQFRLEDDAAFIAVEDNIREEMIAINRRTISLMHDYLDEVEESEEPLSKSIKTLFPIAADMADRTGHGKHSSSTSVQVNFAQMMKEQAARRGRSNVIDAKSVPNADLAPALQGPSPHPNDAVPAEQPSPVVGFRRRA